MLYLDESGVQVDVVRHDDGPNDAHGLKQLLGPAVLAVEDEESAHHLGLVRGHHHVLRHSKADIVLTRSAVQGHHHVLRHSKADIVLTGTARQT